MSLSIKNLFESNLLNGAVLIAGENGINNEIIWINILEILDEVDYLQKGELLLTTGYMLNNEVLYKNLVLNLYLKGLSGLAIQVGYYLEDIPQYIIDAGNRYNFPIIKIPKELTFSDITQTILKNAYNIKYNPTSQNNKLLLKNLSIGNEPDFEENSEIVHQLNLSDNSYLCVFILSAENAYENVILKDTASDIIKEISNYFNSKNILFIIENLNNNILFLISSKQKLFTQDLTTDLLKIVSSLYETTPQIVLLIGASTIFNNIANLASSYKEACISHSVLKKMNARKGICFYSYISLFKSLGLINSDKHTIKFFYEKIKPLLDYDLAHQSNYLDTLRSFLNNGCNINVTSEKLYIHRHTLRYRLSKIKDLLNIDFADSYSKLDFSIAIYLHDLFS